MANVMNKYFRRRYKRFDGDISIKVDLSNYATKPDLKNVLHIDVSSFVLKSKLASLETEVDKIDANKLKTVPVDLATLSNVVKNDVIKKTEYDKLVAKVNGIDDTNFVSKTKYKKGGLDFEDKINKIEKKIPDISSLVKKTDFNTKITEIEGKMPDVSSLVKKTNFNTKVTEIENKVPDVSSLVKKTDYATEITNMKNDYFTNVALNARHKDLVQKTTFKSEFKKVDDKTSENSSKVLSYEHKLKQRKNSTFLVLRVQQTT